MAQDLGPPSPQTGSEVDGLPGRFASPYSLAIRRVDNAVCITLTSTDSYASIELFDRLVEQVGRGSLTLAVQSAKR